MTFKDCIDFTSETELCFLASSEGHQARVRGITLWFADDSGFYFLTSPMKHMLGQLQKNPRTEIIFWAADEQSKQGKTLRVSGQVDFLEDRSLKERAITDNPHLKNFGLTADSPELIIFRLAHGQAHFWSMEVNLQPRVLIDF